MIWHLKRITAPLAALALLGAHAAIAADAGASSPAVQIHGYMLNRMYAAQGASPEFRTERISVSALAPLQDTSNAYVEVYYHPWAPGSSGGNVYLESAYYDTPFAGGRLRVGKGRGTTFGMTPAYPNRKTTNYGIVSEAFTQDRVQGLQYTYQKGALDAGIAIREGMRLGTRNIGELSGDSNRVVKPEPNQVPHLSFRDLGATGDTSDKLEIAGRVGGVWPNGLRGGVSFLVGRVDKRDLANLLSTAVNTLNPEGGAGTALIQTPTTNKTRNVVGFDVEYKSPCGFVAQGEFYGAKASLVRYNAWDVLFGLEPTRGNMRYYVRYSQQNIKHNADVPLTANPLSWDTRQVSLSVVQTLRKNLWLQYEAEINDEKPLPGIPKRKNNLFFVELFTGF